MEAETQKRRTITDGADAVLRYSSSLKSITLSALFIVVGAFIIMLSFWWNRSELLTAYDGSINLEWARQQFSLHTPLWRASLNFLEGSGDIRYPVNFRLFPSFVLADLFSFNTFGRVALYSEVALELFVANLILSYVLGLSLQSSIASASLYIILMLPFFGMGLIWSNFSVSPQNGSLSAATIVIAASFILIGTRSRITNVLLGGVIIVLSLWFVFAATLAIVPAVPFLFFAFAGWGLKHQQWAERKWKIGICVFASLVLVNPALFFLAVSMNTAAFAIPNALMNTNIQDFWMLTSIAFQWSPRQTGFNASSPMGPLLVLLALGGIASTFCKSRSRASTELKMTGRLTLIFFLIVLCLSLYLRFGSWRGPASFYFELSMIPIYCILAVKFVGFAFEKTGINLANRVQSYVIFYAACSTTILLSLASPRSSFQFAFPPRSNPLIEDLQRDISLQDGDLFRGRVAVMTGRRFNRILEPVAIWMDNTFTAVRLGNDLNISGLEYFSIPHLFPYSPTIVPIYFAFMTRFLAESNDLQQRNLLLLRHIDSKILRLLGVARIVTDAPIDGMNFSFHQKMIELDPLHLDDTERFIYPLNYVNLGDFSPITITLASSVLDGFEKVGRPEFDVMKEVVVSQALPVDVLAPASLLRFSFHGNLFRIQAKSKGDSILVLPVQYSSCFEIVNRKAPGRLFRADIVLTGLLFNGEIDSDISLQTGPFTNPSCRSVDLRQQYDLELNALDETAGRAR